jgi:hypothetical protein
MSEKTKIILISVLTFVFYCCGINPVTNNPDTVITPGFYYLQDPSVKISQVVADGINKQVLQSTSFISENDISFYDYSSHCIYLKSSKYPLFPDFVNGDFPASYTLKPFIVIVNSARCYAGFFSNRANATYYNAPYIRYLDMTDYPDDILHLSGNMTAPDQRENDALKQYLINSKLYHAGIAVEVTNVILYRAETSTIEYEIKITNNDDDNLYIFDPDKSGTGIFHYFNSGPGFFNPENNQSFWASNKASIQMKSYWQAEWFTKIESHGFITRKIILKGYPNIPAGNYVCYFKYAMPATNLEKKDRELADGRYYIGPINAKTFNISL